MNKQTKNVKSMAKVHHLNMLKLHKQNSTKCYVTSSMSRQNEPKPALLLATEVGKMTSHKKIVFLIYTCQ